MLYDLNIPWSATQTSQELQRTISFLSELGYNTVALNYIITGGLPSQLVNPIPLTQPFPIPKKTTLLRRCTLHIDDPSLNYRLSALASTYDILALRPTSEKAFSAACTTLSEHSIISLDLTQRFLFPFRPKPFMAAVNRGIRFEICYAQATMGDAAARRNFISGTLGILRATRGRGLIVSSEAGDVLGVRAPADVVNLLGVWGMGRDKGLESLGVNPRGVVVNEGLKRSGFRGVIDVIEGGAKDKQKNDGKKGAQNSGKANKNKRRVDEQDTNGDSTLQVSKRQAKKMRLEALKASKKALSPAQSPIPTNDTAGDPESLSTENKAH